MEPSEKEEIRTRTDIVDLISGYTALRPAGRRFKALCPFHPEKTPSFTVDPEKGLWRCYGSCSIGGDVFAFMMKAEGLSFPEAAERLAERAGITLSRGGGGSSGNREEAERSRGERDRLFAANAMAARFFRETFARARLAQDYAQKRGLVHDTLQSFGIGFAPDDWSQLADFLCRNGVLLADAEKAGLVTASKRGDGTYIDRFRGRLIFPILDIQERVCAFGGRLILPADNAPKYLNSPETPVFSKSRILYGLTKARRAIQEQDRVVVVEGYMDVVAAHQAGIAFVVATLGTSLTDEHVRLIRRYAKNVVLSYDADDAGVRAALRAAELFQTIGDDMALRVLSLPRGEDPDSMLGRGDVAGFRKTIDSALTVPEFDLRSREARHDTATDEGKMAFLREAIPIIAGVPSALEQDRLVRRYAYLHPSGGTHTEESLRAEIARFRRSGNKNNAGNTISGGSFLDAPSEASGPPVALRGEIILPSEQQPRRGSGNYPRRAFDAGGSNGPAAYPARQPQQPPPRMLPPETPSPAPVARRLTAAQQAERILIAAFLSDEWATRLRRRMDPALFSDPMTVRLIQSLRTLIDGGYTPGDALDELNDDALRDYADAILLSSDQETEISEKVLLDCLRVLKIRREQGEIAEIRRVWGSNAEGKPHDDDELLRRWEQKARALKRTEEAGEDESREW